MPNKATEKDLASRVHYLPVSLESRVQLWLTYKNLKPVSTVSLRKNAKTDARLKKWTSDAGLHILQDKVDTHLYYVSYELSCLHEIGKIMWSVKPKDIIKKGELFGYPQEATLAFSQKEQVAVLVPSNFPHYWAAYVRYIVRKDHEVEESQVGKKWADTIRKDLPKLAEWFERNMASVKLR